MSKNEKKCHSFVFFDVSPAFCRIDDTVCDEHKKAFLSILEERSGEMEVAGYKLIALKAGIHFMLHLKANSVDEIQNFIEQLLHTELGKHLKITYSLLGLRRHTEYRTQKPTEEKPFVDGAMKYFIVYPFTKTTEWHLLPFEERKEMMKEHVIVAKKHSHAISQLLLYSYGIDDHEFIVAYQTDDLEAFQTLVMDLRHTEGRRYTQNDLPIFTTVYAPLAEIIKSL